MGVGQLGPPGRNYFIGDITGFTFRDFVLDGKPVSDPEAAQFDFADGAGAGFTFEQGFRR